MVMEILNKFNFLDIIILFILFRIFYIALKTGLPIELFKLMGALSATFFSLHYYVKLSDIIQRSSFCKELSLRFLDFLIFLILVFAGYLVFVILRNIFYNFIKLEAVSGINKIGGLVLGLARGYLTIGLLVYTLTISGITYLNQSVKYSYLGSRAFSIAPNTYNWLWDNFVSKFSTEESFNREVSKVTAKFKDLSETK